MREMCNTVASPHTFQLAADATAAKKKPKTCQTLKAELLAVFAVFSGKRRLHEKTPNKQIKSPIELVC